MSRYINRFMPFLVALGAVVLTVVTYLAVRSAAGPDAWLYELFYERSWIQHINTLFFWFTLLALSVKLGQHRQEAAACRLAHGVVSDERYKGLTWQNAYVLADALQAKGDQRYAGSLVFTRVRRALDRLQKTMSTAELREYLRLRSDIDGAELESSYAGIRYFAWLIPTLGFIGTVLGIGEGISSCGSLITGAAVGSGELPDITPALDALGTAFDTTLLALVYSAIVIFFMSYLTRQQEELLEQIDHLCIDEVCGSFQEHSTANDELIRRLLAMEEKLIENVHGDRAELCNAIVKRMPPALAKTLADIEEMREDDLAKRIVPALQRLEERVAGLAEALRAGTSRSDRDGMAEKLERRLAAVEEHARQRLDSIDASLASVLHSLRQLGDLASDLRDTGFAIGERLDLIVGDESPDPPTVLLDPPGHAAEDPG